MDCNTIESWKPIPGYEGLYEASNFGQIRSAPGKTTSSARFNKRVWKTRVLKQKHTISENQRGDGRVCLWKDGAPKEYYVSRLVASSWLGVQPDNMTVNHINGDWLNNHIENLEWVTREDNIRIGFNTGAFSANQIPVSLTSADGDVIKDFPSMSAASRFLGRRNSYVSDRMREGYKTVIANDIKHTEYVVSKP